MNDLIDRPMATQPTARRVPRHRAAAWWERVVAHPMVVHGGWVLVPLLILTAVPRWIDLGRLRPSAVEGDYVTRAYALTHWGGLTYDYVYSAPPLGWWQLAAVDAVTGAFDSVAGALFAGRIIMIGVAAITAVLLWFLARGLRLSQPAAAVTVALVAVAPVAVELQRRVLIENVATAWLLGALILAASVRRGLAMAAASGVCFVVAALSWEGTLLLLPMWLWLMWRSSSHQARRYGLALAVSVFALSGLVYLLMGAPTGSMLGDMSGVSRTDWSAADIVLALCAIAAAAATCVVPAMRPLAPIAVGFAPFMLWWLLPGELPASHLAPAVALGALLIAGVGQYLLEHVESARTALLGALSGPLLTGALVLLCLVAVTVTFAGAPLGAAQAAENAPLRQAQRWLDTNVPVTDRVITDEALWVDVVRAGRSRSDVIGPRALEQESRGTGVVSAWRSYDWIVVTPGLRSDAGRWAQTAQALRSSAPVARFGGDADRVEVRGIRTEQVASQEQERAGRVAAGEQLVVNPQLRADAAIQAKLVDGEVDARLLATLAAALGAGGVEIVELDAVAGEDAAGTPLRRAVLRSLSSVDLAEFYATQRWPYRPQVLDPDGEQLLVAYPPLGGDGLLPT